MSPEPLACPVCRAILSDLGAPGAPAPCPHCARPLEGLAFPALSRVQATGQAAEALIAAEDAACFYHPASRAQVPCDACGRFLCALCDIELAGQHICPSCLETGRKKQRIQQFDDSRVLYGGIALLTAVFPLFIWMITFITAPLSVAFALWGWRKPQSLVGTWRLSYIFAILIGTGTTIAWVIFFLDLFHILKL